MARPFSIYNLPTDRARELFEPSEKAESLLASIKTLLCLNFFWCDVTTGEVKGF